MSIIITLIITLRINFNMIILLPLLLLFIITNIKFLYQVTLHCFAVRKCSYNLSLIPVITIMFHIN